MSRLPFEQMIEMRLMGSGFSSGIRTPETVGARDGVRNSVLIFLAPFRSSDATLGLAQPGDPRRELARPLGEELVEGLHVHTGVLRDAPQAGRLTLARGVFTAEGQDAPVLLGERPHSHLLGDRLAHVRGPLRAVDEETFVVDLDDSPGVLTRLHAILLSRRTDRRRPGWPRVAACPPSTCGLRSECAVPAGEGSSRPTETRVFPSGCVVPASRAASDRRPARETRPVVAPSRS